MKRIALAFLIAFLAAWFVPISDTAAKSLSFLCLAAGGIIAGWLLFNRLQDLRQLRRGLREDQEPDRPFARERPDWMRKTNRNRPQPKHFTP